MKKLTPMKEKIIKLYLLDKYNTKLDISKTLKVNQGYVVQVIKQFNENTIISNDFGLCQSFYNNNKFYLFTPNGIEKILILSNGKFYSYVDLSYTEKNFIENNTGIKVYESQKPLL
jgi:hypothetical protein